MKRMSKQMLTEWQRFSDDTRSNIQYIGLFQEPDGSWSVTDGNILGNVNRELEGCVMAEKPWNPVRARMIDTMLDDKSLDYTRVEVDLEGVKAFRDAYGNKQPVSFDGSGSWDTKLLMRFLKMAGKDASVFVPKHILRPMIAHNELDDGTELWCAVMPVRNRGERILYGMKKEQDV